MSVFVINIQVEYNQYLTSACHVFYPESKALHLVTVYLLSNGTEKQKQTYILKDAYNS